MKVPFALPIRALVLAFSIAAAAACGKSDSLTDPGQGGSTAILDVTNSTQVTIYYVRVRACGSQTWGADLLGANVIEPGLGQSFTMGAGCHDVKLETSHANNREAVFSNVSFPAGQIVSKTVSSWSAAQ